MRKIFTIIVIVLLSLALLSGCGNGVSKEEYDTLYAEFLDAQSAITDITAERDSLADEMEELRRAYDEATKSVSTPAPQNNDMYIETPTPVISPAESSPWAVPLPSGLTAEVQRSDDNCTIFVHFWNNTGSDISMTTYYIFGDRYGNPYMNGGQTTMFFRNDSEKIVVLDAWDEIYNFTLACEVSDVYKKIQEANDGLWAEYWRNNDNSITATFHSPHSVSIAGNLFFLDDGGNVIGYQSIGLGGMMPFTTTFDAPNYSYSDYLICYEAIA